MMKDVVQWVAVGLETLRQRLERCRNRGWVDLHGQASHLRNESKAAIFIFEIEGRGPVDG